MGTIGLTTSSIRPRSPTRRSSSAGQRHRTSSCPKSWLLARLVGTKCNRDAVGARAYVYVRGRRLSGEVQTGTSYISQNDPRLHFGLGDDQAYDRIEVQWPGGVRETFPGGKANRIIELKQGAGTAKPSTLKPGEGRPHI